MKAAIINNYGSEKELEVVENYPMPRLNDDEVLVKIYATSVNPIDYKARQGLLAGMFNWSFPVVLGWDISGKVVSVGKNVKNCKNGDRVYARPDHDPNGKYGSYAEFMAVKEDKLSFIPNNISFTEAAAVPLAAETALQMLRKLEVGPNKKILVQAGAGGVGIFAIQIAKIMGATVATTVSEQNINFVKKLGADVVIDYHKTNVSESIEDYDAVLDSTGAIEDGLSILKIGGKLITISSAISENQKKLAYKNKQSVTSGWLNPNGDDLKIISNYIEKNLIKIIIDSEYNFTTEGIQEAHIKSESHHARGKIIIKMS